MEVLKTWIFNRNDLIKSNIITFGLFLDAYVKIHVMENGVFVVEGLIENREYKRTENHFQEIREEKQINALNKILEKSYDDSLFN